ALAYSHRAESLLQFRYFGAKFVPAPAIADLVFAAEDERIIAAGAAEQIFREVKRCVRKEARIKHALAIHQHPLAALTDDASGVPECTPEFVRVLDRPGVKRI